MFYEVIPEGKVEALTYNFDDDSLLPGQIVTVPVGRRVVPGVVVKKVARPNFKTKSILKVLCSKPLPRHLLKTVDFIHKYYLVPSGQAVSLILPRGVEKKRRKTEQMFGNNSNRSELILSGTGVAPARRYGRSAPSSSVVTSGHPLKNRFQAPLKLALIGRPNVGKSSLFNSLAKKQQAIVSSKQGTTRDVNRVAIKYKGREIEILDTAGLRKPGKREVGIEKFSAIRTLAAIEEADICCLLIDSTESHSKLDQSLAGQIVEAGKGIIMVVTKSDLLDSATPTNYFGEENIENRTSADYLIDALEKDFDFLPYAPVVLTSSETGKNVTKIFELALQIDENRHLTIKTAELNKILNDAISSHIPAGLKNTKPKPKYIVQTDTCPPWFVVHGHDLGLLHWSWKRYLERKIREKYPFMGTPIMFSYRSDDN